VKVFTVIYAVFIYSNNLAYLYQKMISRAIHWNYQCTRPNSLKNMWTVSSSNHKQPYKFFIWKIRMTPLDIWMCIGV